MKKLFITAIKIAVSVGLIVLVFRQLNWEQIRLMLKSANPFFFALSVVFFLLSQLFSIFRFNLFIRKVGVRISFKTNAQLYLLGMFYNFFLPGGVGGYAYKAYALSKSHQKSLKKIGQVVFVDRFLGIVAIGFSICLLFPFLQTPLPNYVIILSMIVGLLGVFMVLKLIVRYMHVHKKRIYVGFIYSVIIQFLQILTVFFILKSFQVETGYFVYFFLFLVSSVLSVISFAGLGIREAVFYYGAEWFLFNADVSASVALSFSLITAFISFLGILYLIKPIKIK